MLKIIILISFVVFAPLLSVVAATSPNPPHRPSSEVVIPTPVLSPKEAPVSSSLDAIDEVLTSVQNRLKEHDLLNGDLLGETKKLAPLHDQLVAVIAKITPFKDNINARLVQIGPKGGSESKQVTTEREDLTRHFEEADGFLKRANLFMVEVAQAQTDIAARQKALFVQSSWWKGYIWDVPDDLKTAFFGFKLGDVMISPFRILIAIFLFVFIFVGWRAALGWVDRKLLNRLEFGSRNSVHTTLGYIGFVVAFCFAINYLGVDLGKLTLIVGALSVGIGFGLQAIVGNFISGLIILWERTIRIGDLIMVGTDRGVVSKISIRATTLDTPDHSQVIIPNSLIVSGIVSNFVRNDRTGKVVVSLVVRSSVDLGVIKEKITALVLGDSRVLTEPKPHVEIVSITPDFINLEVSAFIMDIEAVHEVRSDLYFMIVKFLKLFDYDPHPPVEKKRKKPYIRPVNLED